MDTRGRTTSEILKKNQKIEYGGEGMKRGEIGREDVKKKKSSLFDMFQWFFLLLFSFRVCSLVYVCK
jgi:hypothetical protein